MHRRRELEEGEAPALLVTIQQDHFALLSPTRTGGLRPMTGDHHHRARPAADEGMLPTLAMPGVIGECTVRLGYAAIVLADAPAHLRYQRLPQGLEIAERGFRISILSIEMFADIRWKGTRILQDVAPVLGF